MRAYYAGGSTLSGGGGGGPSTEADTARAPFYTNGNNRCAFSGSVDDRGGWCDPFNGGSAATDWDTSMVAGLSGETIKNATYFRMRNRTRLLRQARDTKKKERETFIA